MTVIAITEAAGTSAATTTALGLAITWPGGVVLVELDPSGGDLASWLDLSESRGIMTLAASPSSHDETGLTTHAQQTAGGLPVIVAPMRSTEAAVAVPAAAARLTNLVGQSDITIIVDLGRFNAAVLPCDEMLVVVRQSPDSPHATVARIERTAEVVKRATASAPTRLLVVGDVPYRPDDIARHLGIALAGTIALDPTGASLVAGRTATRKTLAKCRLLQCAAQVAADLKRDLDSRTPSA